MPSENTQLFVDLLTIKFDGKSYRGGDSNALYVNYTIESGRRFDRIIQQISFDAEKVTRAQRMCYAFVDRTNDCLLKAAGWKAPAKIQGYYLPKYDLSTTDGMAEAVFNADPYGSFLYDSYKIQKATIGNLA